VAVSLAIDLDGAFLFCRQPPWWRGGGVTWGGQRGYSRPRTSSCGELYEQLGELLEEEVDDE